ncbi:MAG TPA: acyl-CoA dehydrogenase family protein, partial [Cystobacter sp.]
MEFQLSESQRALQEMARKFAREVIRPKAAHHDETSEFPRAIIASAWENGLLNMNLPESCGGLGLAHLDQLLAYEELAWGCSGMATSITANDLANLPIVVGATEEQKKRLLTPFTEKFKLASFCLTEPEAGSDVAGMSTTAVRDGDHYVLNGAKCFITN